MRPTFLALVPLLALSACQLANSSAAPADTPDLDAAAEEAAVTLPATLVGPDAPTLTVYKSPTCGCCAMWVEHMEAAGFTVDVRDRDDMAAVKDSLGVPSDLASCHTGVVDGYVVEGHVPAEQVARLLEERPEARGLSVPGMPIGSPGMEMGDRRDPYDVLIVGPEGEAAVFTHVEGNTGP
ncbi:DUF411 domain-containing protein [Rubrivirga sp.]|uniref:DUF411 domain-containing protein n=1 Tax=Rubrivirga sp. TaxID=1885344 RepID=UPI003B5261D8